ncbi:hypothetical protein WICANDRAFT_76596 [Wickerhamomyces anomalus NRRL Y-366-8]|uniref:Dystroglycan-type cadherin-like domain-containing protein n=1 Tax=Wickerhamomyces anomalus (strain ATCC 58044 / CBS 1984 / NCYC 433 / NRRL Y-366-8) TaxID=683960 RepID=A0A1E3PAI0_WICAA|nr:uncharacterized protein WICANDRAFT_76596 [Wickerhamomyces anomalus NRRL Y-366-8]ODQ62429.1 hypothetical protein WICANDRAFT_76596 [Wickerhamomyces anomalus NRRL Y-366-8]
MSFQLILRCCFILWFTSIIRAQPREGFPFDEQLPTVARANEAYEFQMSNETFISSDGDVTYSAKDLPSWLSFDPTSRTLSGTPNDQDVTDSAGFTLMGQDNDGEITKQYSIVVSKNKGPTPSDSYTVLSQLSDFGQTNGQNGLVLAPGKVFNVTFDSKTFDSDDEIKGYYGRSSDRSSLPNWLFFDSSTLRFSGVAPAVNSEIAPGFQYSFIFIATDYAGNAGSWVDFDIVVGYHDLTTSLKGVTNVNGSSGDDINFEIPLENVYQDGAEISLDNISYAGLNGAPDWLKLDNYTLVGTVPEDFKSGSNDTFNVTIYDHYSNSVVLYFAIETIDSLFSVDSFRDANATRGSYFQYYFLPSQFTDFSNTNLTVEFEDADWLSFHSSNLTINGETPDEFDETQVTVKAHLKNSDDSDELSFKIYGSDPLSSSSSSRSHSSTSSSSSRSSASASSSSSSGATVSATSASSNGNVSKSPSGRNKKALAIGLGVGIPLFLILVAGILIFLCCFKRRKNDKSDEEDSSNSPKISKPILGNPANGPNSRSPNGASPMSGAAAASGVLDEKQDWNEPHRLGALNVLKLDGKDLYENESNSSSLTKGDSFDSIHDDTHSSLYHDALQAQSTDMLMSGGAAAAGVGAAANHYNKDKDAIPKKSWRQTIDSKINRESLNSLATVSTNELFSIRLADDDDIRKDPRKSNLSFRDSAFLGSTASSILTRDDSGNIQKLDSDGNIVDLKNRHSKGRSLDVLKEEQTPHLHQPSSFQPTTNKSSLVNDTSFSSNATSSTGGEEFYPVETTNGIEWKQNQKNKFTFENGSVHTLGDTKTQGNNGNNNKARLVDFTNKARADTSNDVSQSTYETAEIESL